MSDDDVTPRAIQYDLKASEMADEYGVSSRNDRYAQVRKVMADCGFEKAGESFYVNSTPTAAEDLEVAVAQLRSLSWFRKHLNRFGSYKLELVWSKADLLSSPSEPQE